MNLKILVVDDEPDVPLLIKQRFRKEIQEKKRIDFRFAGNGMEALEILEKEPDVGIVLSDINMPEMDGLTLLSKLTGRGPLPKAVIVSAYGDMDNIRIAMNRGAFDFLTKPIDFHDLEATIDKTRQEFLLIKQALETRDELVGLRRELEVAARIQRSLLPRAISGNGATGRFDLFAHVIPAQEIGGDFYDYFMLDKKRLGFAVADVSGKGVGAALFGAMSRTLFRAAALVGGGSSGDCLARLNDLLCADNSDSRMFVTACYGILDLETGDVEFARGGHPPPFIAGPSGVRSFDISGDMIIGMVEQQEFRVWRERLAPGEYFVVYSDGISEAMNEQQELYSIDRLGVFLKNAPHPSSQELAKAIIADVAAYQGAARQSDDITVMTLGYRG